MIWVGRLKEYWSYNFQVRLSTIGEGLKIMSNMIHKPLNPDPRVIPLVLFEYVEYWREDQV